MQELAFQTREGGASETGGSTRLNVRTSKQCREVLSAWRLKKTPKLEEKGEQTGELTHEVGERGHRGPKDPQRQDILSDEGSIQLVSNWSGEGWKGLLLSL